MAMQSRKALRGLPLLRRVEVRRARGPAVGEQAARVILKRVKAVDLAEQELAAACRASRVEPRKLQGASPRKVCTVFVDPCACQVGDGWFFRSPIPPKSYAGNSLEW